ncbi:hypothetical protein EDB19DRAFT_1832225 [Suillus lakei]|nr:hypothetical protein EDB19DRAFT_1832225 [Suillus lakei]
MTLGSPPKCSQGHSTTWRTRLMTPSKAPSDAPPTSQLKVQTGSQSHGPPSTPDVTAVTNPKAQTHGRSKTITAVKPPAPAPASIPFSSLAALNVPMPDLHAMAMAIQDGAAQIAILEGRVAEQDGKIDTLQHLHESFCCKIINQHPSFPLPEPPANATSLLLDQSILVSMSPPKSALPPLIDFSMGGMAPTPPTVEDASAIEGLLFEYSEVHLEGPNTSGKNVDLGDLGNLVPEYNPDDMNVEVKVEKDDMATKLHSDRHIYNFVQ